MNVSLVVLVGVACLLPSTARAEPERAEAELGVERASGAEGCLDAERLAFGVEERLGRVVFGAGSAARLRVKVAFDRPSARDYRARLALESARGKPLGQRELVTSAAHCSALDASVALVVAMLVDSPEAAAERGEADPGSAPAPPTSRPESARASAPVGRSLTIPSDTAAPREPWGVRASLSGAVLLGGLPGVAPGAALALELEPPRAPAFVVGAEWLPSRPGTTAGGTRGVELGLARLLGLLCPFRVGGRTTVLEPCAGQSLGWVTARGVGFGVNRRERRLSYTLGGSVLLHQRLFGPISARFSLAAEAPLSRASFLGRTAAGTTTLFRQRPAWLSGELGLEVAP